MAPFVQHHAAYLWWWGEEEWAGQTTGGAATMRTVSLLLCLGLGLAVDATNTYQGYKVGELSTWGGIPSTPKQGYKVSKLQHVPPVESPQHPTVPWDKEGKLCTRPSSGALNTYSGYKVATVNYIPSGVLPNAQVLLLIYKETKLWPWLGRFSWIICFTQTASKNLFFLKYKNMIFICSCTILLVHFIKGMVDSQ